jgi:prepilin-type N-terminal cleavage/methylation domain-containing protein
VVAGVLLARFGIRGGRLKIRASARRLSADDGFTLIEMAIVMVVIGLLLSGGILALAPVIQSSKTTDTNSRLDRVEQALLVYVIQNGCLPCPTDPTLASTAALAGQASTTSGPQVGCSASACSFIVGATGPGAVPWITLGLSEADATDGFGNRIAYAIGPATAAGGLQNLNGMERTPPSSYPSGSITVRNYANPEPGTSVQQTAAAAYILISYGSDASFAHAAGTGALQATKYGQVAGDTSPEGTNATGGAGFFVQDTLYGVGGAGYFDDIVRWRTAANIIQGCGSSACGNP